jgi:hypothetical protein
MTGRLIALSIAAALAASGAAAQTRATEILAPNEQRAFVPGYPVGNIAIGSPKIADFKVLTKDRRELLLFGRSEGQTTLTVWDQRGVKRHELTVIVRVRVNPDLERELKLLLRDFPSVRVETLNGLPVLAGAVTSKDDLTAIDKIAAAAKVRSLVRYQPPASVDPAAGGLAVPAQRPLPAATGGQPLGPTAGSDATHQAGLSPTGRAEPPSTPAAAPAFPAPTASHVQYEIELLEASARFRSGSYGRGVEPSGRQLYRGVIDAPVGGDGEIFIGGKAVGGKDARKAGGSQVEQGIRLTLRPHAPDGRGRFVTAVLVETNLPIGFGSDDPNTWRRARWTFTTLAEEPFGITGDDLLASPGGSPGGGSGVGSAVKGAAKIARLPGVPRNRGTEMVPVFGSLFGSSSYKKKETQLLVIIRLRIVSGSGS